MKETFLENKEFPGYLISDQGNVMSVKRNQPHLLSKNKSRLGYPLVLLYNNHKMSCQYIARLVLSTFVGYPADPHLCYADYYDGDISNCRLDNLHWIVCETTPDYDPTKSKRRGILKPEGTKGRMTRAKLNQSPESLKKGAETRRETCRKRNENNE